jgi:hypothetical protein
MRMLDRIVPNGSVVIAVYPDGSGETKAFFQYEGDADDFCRAPRDKGGPMLIRVSMFDGRFMAFPADPIEAPA